MHEPPLILSIEDEVTMRRALVAYLTDSGYSMIEAGNGRLGLERIFEEAPDVILCDLRMPELDGMGVLEELNKRGMEIPFIVVSGSGEMIDAIRALRLGAWDYIVKPIEDMGILEHAVKRALNHARLLKENREFREELQAANHSLQESLRQIEEDEQAARYIQFQMFPKHSVFLGGCTFDYFLKTSALLSGDFLDYFRIDDARSVFYIADVSGHGAPSALVTVLLKSAIGHLMEEYRSFGNETILYPERVLGLLNETISTWNFEKYLTIFYALMDNSLGTLQYCNAGHFPYPVFHDGSTSRFLTEKNLPVGLFPDARYTSQIISLPATFSLALFSDGVLEVVEAACIAEKERIVLEVMKFGIPDTGAMKELLGLDGVGQVVDDITVLVVRKGR